jgi:hypothetical protein
MIYGTAISSITNFGIANILMTDVYNCLIKYQLIYDHLNFDVIIFDVHVPKHIMCCYLKNFFI